MKSKAAFPSISPVEPPKVKIISPVEPPKVKRIRKRRENIIEFIISIIYNK